MIEIDGSMGEGGGQVLRSALTLAVLTGQPLHLHNIRAGRSRPGLQAQHLTAVKAAARISGARVEGARRGATELRFEPGPVRSGRYHFEIGTAGATSLVLQTLFLPLSRANAASTVSITGGTHVPWSPCFHYLESHWLVWMRRLGYKSRLTLQRAGFYPRGDGHIQAVIRPAGALSPLRLDRRGRLLEITGISGVANLDRSIAERQRRQARYRLGERYPVRIRVVDLPARVKGTFLLLQAVYESGPCGSAAALGARGKPAEQVADEAVEDLKVTLEAPEALDPHLSDQLLLPLAFAPGESRFRTARVTRHLLTNAAVIRAFLPARIEIDAPEGDAGQVTVGGSKDDATKHGHG